jgi:hypothetical protein
MSCEDIPSLLDLQNTKKHVDDLGRLMGTGTGTSTNEVTGQVRPTYNKTIEDMGFRPGSGDFTTGFTVMPGERDIAWYNPTDNNWYSYLGIIPSPGGQPVAPGTDPAVGGLWKPVTDSILRYDLSQPNGTDLVGFSLDQLYLPATAGFRLKNTVYLNDKPFSDEASDDAAMDSAIAYCKANKKSLYIPARAIPWEITTTKYPDGLTIIGDGEQLSRINYSGTGALFQGTDATIAGAVDQRLFNFHLYGLYIVGPGKTIVGSKCIDGNVYRSSFDRVTISGFEEGLDVRGAIIEVGFIRVTGCAIGIAVRPYKSRLPTTTCRVNAHVDTCDIGINVDHVYAASGSWPTTSGSGGAASICFDNTVVEQCGTGYKVNRASTTIFNNAYTESCTIGRDITSSINPIIINSYQYLVGSNSFSWTGLAEVDQGFTEVGLWGVNASRLFVGGANSKGGSGKPFESASGRAIRSYLSGGVSFVQDTLATTKDWAWFGDSTQIKDFVLLGDPGINHIRLNSYLDGGGFGKTIWVSERVSGKTVFGDTTSSGSFLVTFNGHIGPRFDNTYDFGSATFRGRVAYFGTGSINTSDAREKTEPKDISEILMDIADSIDISAWKWLSSISAKGEDLARWHFGPIAQQISDVFIHHGLNGCDYGLLCYDKWDEQKEDEIDENGNKTGNTITITEAGDRWGIRPDQCHWLMLAAARRRAQRAEDRVSAIEDRLSKAGM